MTMRQLVVIMLLCCCLIFMQKICRHKERIWQQQMHMVLWAHLKPPTDDGNHHCCQVLLIILRPLESFLATHRLVHGGRLALHLSQVLRAS